MARYHVNPEGNVGPCRAKHACPYGDFDTDHFDSPEEARTAYESGQLNNAFTTLSKTVDKVIDESVADDELLAGIRRAGWPEFKPGDESMPVILFGEAQSGKTAGGNAFAEDGKIVKLNDDELLEAINRADWPVFDPAKGDDQFDYVEPSWMEPLRGQEVTFVTNQALSPETQDTYRKLLSDVDGKASFAGPNLQDEAPEGFNGLTDETMQEMDAYYQANPLMSVDIDTSKGAPVFTVLANGESVYETESEEVAALGTRISRAGVWTEFNAIDEKGKEYKVNRYVKKGMDYIYDGKLDNEDRRREIGVSRGPKQVAALKDIENDERMLHVASQIIIREAEAERGLRIFNVASENPPF